MQQALVGETGCGATCLRWCTILRCGSSDGERSEKPPMTKAKKTFLSLCVPALLCVGQMVQAQQPGQITVDTSRVVNSFSPLRALGGSIDRQRGGSTKDEIERHTQWVLTDPALKELLGAGWGTVTYRQNTELQIEAWHWNPRGAWSNPKQKEGY